MSRKLYRHSWDRLVPARAAAWPDTSALRGGGGGGQRGPQCVAELVVVMVWLYARVGVTVTSAVTNQSLCHRVRNTPSPAC
jgi:hypothetical protein